MPLQDLTDAPLVQLPERKADSHKGTYGKLLAVGGSVGMGGSIAIAGLAALRSGAGLVTAATPAPVLPTVAGFSACYMTLPLVADDQGSIDLANIVDLREAMDRFDVWAVGPGIGRTPGVTELVAQLYRQTPAPMIVDADGLYALAQALGRDPDLLAHAAGPRILTPHVGEFRRLINDDVADSPAQRAAQAAALCRRDSGNRTILVVKGHQTIVTDGGRFAINSTGNAGMATAGAGDCLTGVVAALAGQGLAPWDAARLAVHVHGLAGDLAADDVGQISLIATDLIDYLPRAFQRLSG